MAATSLLNCRPSTTYWSRRWGKVSSCVTSPVLRLNAESVRSCVKVSHYTVGPVNGMEFYTVTLRSMWKSQCLMKSAVKKSTLPQQVLSSSHWSFSTGISVFVVQESDAPDVIAKCKLMSSNLSFQSACSLLQFTVLVHVKFHCNDYIFIS